MPKSIRILIAIFAAGLIANGLVMLLEPHGWFTQVPGVANTGDHNHHFIRDIGAVYITMSAVMIYGLRYGHYLLPALSFSAVWLGLHGAIHLWDVLADRLPLQHLWMDLPGVFLPPILLVFLIFRLRPTTS